MPLRIHPSGESFTVRAHGLILSAAGINSVRRLTMEGGVRTVDLLAWDKATDQDVAHLYATVAPALRLMADVEAAPTREAALKHLRHATRRPGISANPDHPKPRQVVV